MFIHIDLAFDGLWRSEVPINLTSKVRVRVSGQSLPQLENENTYLPGLSLPIHVRFSGTPCCTRFIILRWNQIAHPAPSTFQRVAEKLT